jgi:hypothetical protein
MQDIETTDRTETVEEYVTPEIVDFGTLEEVVLDGHFGVTADVLTPHKDDSYVE